MEVSYTILYFATLKAYPCSFCVGAIAAIVIAIFIFGVVVVCVVLVVVVYRIKTGEWFKLREKDDDKLTVLFEKELLMGNLRTKTKKKSIVTS